jgi:hypothetical protein
MPQVERNRNRSAAPSAPRGCSGLRRALVILLNSAEQVPKATTIGSSLSRDWSDAIMPHFATVRWLRLGGFAAWFGRGGGVEY